MTRRVAFLAAFFSVAAFLPVSAVSADVVHDYHVPEPIARYFPVQVNGPSGLNSPNTGVPWGLDRIDQRVTTRDQRFEYNQTGLGVTVYVADTGVQATHPDFSNGGTSRVLNGWSYRADQDALEAYMDSGFSNCPDTYSLNGVTYQRQFQPTSTFDKPATVDSTDFGTTDNEFHGTHVASTIAGSLVGVAKEVAIVPLRVLDSCGRGNVSTIERGLQWALADHQQRGGISLVNLSLGFHVKVPEIDQLISQMINAGMIVVAAAGNDDPTDDIPLVPDSCLISPAGSDSRVITVASSDSDDDESYFSYRGNCVDVFAPGSSIAGAWAYGRVLSPPSTSTGSFLVISGTSMAAPHVSGALARYVQSFATPSSGASVSDNAMLWLKTEATCNAISYFYGTSPSPSNSPNRLLAVDAPTAVPCAPTSPVATGGVESATVSWTEPVAFNGEVPTYTATAQPGNRQCTTTSTSCTITGLAGGVRHTISVTASNSAGTSAANTTTVTPQTAPVLSGIELVPGNGSIVVRWNSSTTTDTTFTAVASPGGQKCVTTSTTCTIDGLSNNEQYNITVTGANYAGSSSVVGTASPNGAPSVPAAVRTTSRIGRVTFSWSAITDSANPTYTLATRDGSYSCTTTRTTCTIRNLPNGKGRTFYLRTLTSAGGISQLETSVRAWAGFNVRRTELKQSSRILLTSIMTPVSTGRRTWQSSSQCRISGSRLVTPRRATTCYLTLRVAKTQTQPAMSLRLKLAVR